MTEHGRESMVKFKGIRGAWPLPSVGSTDESESDERNYCTKIDDDESDKKPEKGHRVVAELCKHLHGEG